MALDFYQIVKPILDVLSIPIFLSIPSFVQTIVLSVIKVHIVLFLSFPVFQFEWRHLKVSSLTVTNAGQFMPRS